MIFNHMRSQNLIKTALLFSVLLLFFGQLQAGEGGIYFPTMDVTFVVVDGAINGVVLDEATKNSEQSDLPSKNQTSKNQSNQIKNGKSLSTADTVKKLNYVPSMQVRQASYAKVVEQMRVNDAKSAQNLEAILKSKDIITEMDKGLRPFGLRTNNVADVYAVYWINAWEILNGQKQSSKAQSVAVRDQVAQILVSNKPVLALDNTRKQQLSESILLQMLMMQVAYEQTKNRPDSLKELAVDVKRGARNLGFDLDTVALTEKGFKSR
jgi:hypothetical protein